jgi:hypothetical protein
MRAAKALYFSTEVASAQSWATNGEMQESNGGSGVKVSRCQDVKSVRGLTSVRRALAALKTPALIICSLMLHPAFRLDDILLAQIEHAYPPFAHFSSLLVATALCLLACHYTVPWQASLFAVPAASRCAPMQPSDRHYAVLGITSHLPRFLDIDRVTLVMIQIVSSIRVGSP